MKAILEVEFDPVRMITEEELITEFKGDRLKQMQWLFSEEGIGIFEEKLKLVGIRD